MPQRELFFSDSGSGEHAKVHRVNVCLCLYLTLNQLWYSQYKGGGRGEPGGDADLGVQELTCQPV